MVSLEILRKVTVANSFEKDCINNELILIRQKLFTTKRGYFNALYINGYRYIKKFLTVYSYI